MYSVATAVRDASDKGGGMAEVARSIHIGLGPNEYRKHALLVANRHNSPIDGQITIGPSAHEAHRAILEQNPSIVHVHGIWTPFEWRTCKSARMLQRRLVISPHGALEPWSLRNKAMKKKLAWWMYQKRDLVTADLIIVNSEQELYHLRSLELRGPIAVIPNGINLSECPSDIQATPCRRHRERIVLFLGRIDAKKGILDLLAAWRSLPCKNGYRLHIHGFGSSQYEAYIRTAIATMEPQTDVELLPAIFGPEKWRKYSSSSIFVLPSYSENFGITVAEALYCGLPVITTTATPWLVLQNRGLGWIVPNDKEQLRCALISALSLSDAEKNNIALRARQFIAQHYIWPPILARYRETYEWLLNPSSSIPAWIDLSDPVS